MKKIKMSTVAQNGSSKILLGIVYAEEGMDTHLANKDAYFWVQEGKVLFTLDDTQQQLVSQEGVNIPADTAHSFIVQENCKILLILSPEAKIRFVK